MKSLRPGVYWLGIAISLFTAASSSAATGRLFALSSDSSAENTQLIEIDPTTGTGTLIGPVGIDGFTGFAPGPGGQLFGVSIFTGQLVNIDTATGAGTVVADLTSSFTTAGNNGLAFDSNTGELLGFDIGVSNSELFRIDPATGDGVSQGEILVDGTEILDPFGIAFDPATNTLFGLGGTLAAIDLNTLEATTVGPLGNPLIAGLAFDPEVGLLFTSLVGGDALFTIDPSDATLAEIGPIGFPGVTNLAFVLVPEPSAVLLLLAGLGVGAASRRDRGR